MMTTYLRKKSVQASSRSNEIEKWTTDHAEQDATQQMWTVSVIPTRRVFTFVLFFTLVLVVIEVLLRWSSKFDGLGPSVPTYYYLWKFSPVSVLVIASGFWNQLADHVKEATARRREKDVHVLTALITLGRILMAMSVGLSFQLLESQCVKLERKPINLVAHSKFTGDGYISEDVDVNPTLTVAGVNALGRPYPAGTTGQYAFQPFSAATKNPEAGGLVAGIVDLFTPDLKCEAASIVNAAAECSSAGCLDYRLSLTLSTPTCPEYRIAPFEKTPDSTDQYYTDVVSAGCKGAGAMTRDPQLIIVAANWHRDTPKVSSIVCYPSYSLSQAYVSLHQDNGSTHMVIPFQTNNGISDRRIPGVTPADLTAGFMSTLRNVEMPLLTLLDDGVFVGISRTGGIHYSAFHQIANMSIPHSPEDLFGASFLEKVARQSYTSITAQIAEQYLLRHTHEAFQGDSFGNVNRVMVREPFARPVEAGLVALIALSVVIIARSPVTHDASREEVTAEKHTAGMEEM